MATTINDIMDFGLLSQMIEDGYVRTSVHPTFENLVIFNYTERAQFDRVWNDATLNSRGLIYDRETGEVIARPFSKFFNWDDSVRPYPPAGAMTLSTKFDGSLGILYWEPDDVRYYPSIATRGSFTSDQAVHATARIAELMFMMDEEMKRWLIGEFSHPDYTYLFEIIYPQNRIVVDYHGEDRLVLLDVIDKRTGLSDLTRFDDSMWPDKAEKRLVPGGFSDALTHEIPRGEEGFVLYWPGSGFRCKMKSAEYIELHRVITGLSKKSIWEMLRDGKTSDDIKSQVPDELFGFVDETIKELYDAVSSILDRAYDDYDTVVFELIDEKRGEPASHRSDNEYRKAFALKASRHPDTRAFLFKLLDQAGHYNLWKMAWTLVKPTGDSRAWNRTEDVA